MKSLLKSLATVATLSTTALLLVADSARECPHPAQEVSFAVSGDCGPAGVLKLKNPQDSCGFDVENAEALNLPTSGSFDGSPYDVTQGGWTLIGTRQLSVSDGGSGTKMVAGRRECMASLVDGTLKMRCEDTRTDVDPTQLVATCNAVLTPQ